MRLSENNERSQRKYRKDRRPQWWGPKRSVWEDEWWRCKWTGAGEEEDRSGDGWITSKETWGRMDWREKTHRTELDTSTPHKSGRRSHELVAYNYVYYSARLGLCLGWNVRLIVSLPRHIAILRQEWFNGLSWNFVGMLGVTMPRMYQILVTNQLNLTN